MSDELLQLEQVRNPAGWWIRSEEFYYAGKALLSTRQNCKNLYYSKFEGSDLEEKDKNQSKELRSYMNINTPIIYNLAFSCELLVKAILILQNPRKWIPNTGKIKFSNDIFALINTNIPIQLTEMEIRIARRLKDFILYGKYPERINPGKISDAYEDSFDYKSYVNWNLTEYYDIITSMRNKLRAYFFEQVDQKKK
ncbi:MAG: hypothetical protein OCD02_17115 [Spirochaetaceae bacterium]